MQQVGSAARDIAHVGIGSLTNSDLKASALNALGAVEAGTAKVNFEPGGWQQVEGYHNIDCGYIADPITGSVLVLASCPTLTHLFNHYAKGDYPGAV